MGLAFHFTLSLYICPSPRFQSSSNFQRSNNDLQVLFYPHHHSARPGFTQYAIDPDEEPCECTRDLVPGSYDQPSEFTHLPAEITATKAGTLNFRLGTKLCKSLDTVIIQAKSFLHAYFGFVMQSAQQLSLHPSQKCLGAPEVASGRKGTLHDL